MMDLVRVGAGLVLFGFLAVGYASLYTGTAPTPTTPEGVQQALRAAKNAEVVAGVGWILVGLGIAIALIGIAKSDFAIDSKLETVVGRVQRSAKTLEPESNFVCSACGGDISEAAEVCPHCGERIEPG